MSQLNTQAIEVITLDPATQARVESLGREINATPAEIQALTLDTLLDMHSDYHRGWEKHQPCRATQVPNLLISEPTTYTEPTAHSTVDGVKFLTNIVRKYQKGVLKAMSKARKAGSVETVERLYSVHIRLAELLK